MKTVTQKARLRQAIIEYIAEEPWAEELLLQEHHEAPSTEHTVPSNQTHSGQPTQKPVPESSQEPTLPKPIDTSKPNDTVQPFDPSDKHSMSREKNIKTKESVPVETKPGQTTEALVSSRIKQKERPIAKEKRNTVAGEIKTREPTVRSNEALKVSKERGSQTIEPSVAPSGDVKPTTKGAPLPAVQAKVISASNDQIQISQSKEMQKRKVQGESRSPVINSPRATQNSSSSTEKTNAPSKKAHEQTVKESDKIPIREKETIHPRVKEKAVKMRSDKQITQGCLFESH